LKEKPFILATAGSAEKITAVIDTYPSGALSYSINGVEHRDGAGGPIVGYVPNGPYVVRGGGAVLKDAPQGEGVDQALRALPVWPKHEQAVL
jgi:hypothetical protein